MLPASTPIARTVYPAHPNVSFGDSQSCPGSARANSDAASRPCSDTLVSLGTTTAASLGRSQSRKRTGPRVLKVDIEPPPSNRVIEYPPSPASRANSLPVKTCVAGALLHAAALFVIVSFGPLVRVDFVVAHLVFIAAYSFLLPSWDRKASLDSVIEPLGHLVCTDAAVSAGTATALILEYASRRAVLTPPTEVDGVKCWNTVFGCLSEKGTKPVLPAVEVTLTFTFICWVIWYLFARVRHSVKSLSCIFGLGSLALSAASVANVLACSHGGPLLASYALTNLLFCATFFLLPRFLLSPVWDHIGLFSFLGFVTSSVIIIKHASGTMAREAVLVGVIIPVILSNSLAWVTARIVHGACVGICLPMTATDVRRRTLSHLRDAGGTAYSNTSTPPYRVGRETRSTYDRGGGIGGSNLSVANYSLVSI